MHLGSIHKNSLIWGVAEQKAEALSAHCQFVGGKQKGTQSRAQGSGNTNAHDYRADMQTERLYSGGGRFSVFPVSQVLIILPVSSTSPIFLPW